MGFLIISVVHLFLACVVTRYQISLCLFLLFFLWSSLFLLAFLIYSKQIVLIHNFTSLYIHNIYCDFVDFSIGSSFNQRLDIYLLPKIFTALLLFIFIHLLIFFYSFLFFSLILSFTLNSFSNNCVT